MKSSASDGRKNRRSVEKWDSINLKTTSGTTPTSDKTGATVGTTHHGRPETNIDGLEGGRPRWVVPTNTRELPSTCGRPRWVVPTGTHRRANDRGEVPRQARNILIINALRKGSFRRAFWLLSSCVWTPFAARYGSFRTAKGLLSQRRFGSIDFD